VPGRLSLDPHARTEGGRGGMIGEGRGGARRGEARRGEERRGEERRGEATRGGGRAGGYLTQSAHTRSHTPVVPVTSDIVKCGHYFERGSDISVTRP